MYRTISTCTNIEETVGKIYAVLEICTDADPTLKKIWREMARDEDAHASKLRLALPLIRAGEFPGLKIEKKEIDILLSRAQRLLARVKSGAVSIPEALLIAIELEGDFASVHAETALLFSRSNMAQLFSCLAKEDAEHVRALNDYYVEHFGIKKTG